MTSMRVWSEGDGLDLAVPTRLDDAPAGPARRVVAFFLREIREILPPRSSFSLALT